MSQTNTRVGDIPVLAGEDLTGRMIPVRIERAFPHCLWGRSLKETPISSGSKGEDHHDA